ncbi:unnamed protein product [Hydatigera taeniaeformis]|uniref:PH domain-containing protein n=1 Tax=Hydatigena taeniaeformis TaxID=6205 RepID=A0A0R3X7C6_HYDTA|nr:unnamed protein product [Hydatigera taeniaeformis]
MVRRPFLYIYENEKDTLERRIINLKVAHLEYSAQEGEIFGPVKGSPDKSKVVDSTKHPMIFALQYADRKVFMKTGPNASKNEIHEWLYAIDPLMAGEIKRVGQRVPQEENSITRKLLHLPHPPSALPRLMPFHPPCASLCPPSPPPPPAPHSVLSLTHAPTPSLPPSLSLLSDVNCLMLAINKHALTSLIFCLPTTWRYQSLTLSTLRPPLNQPPVFTHLCQSTGITTTDDSVELNICTSQYTRAKRNGSLPRFPILTSPSGCPDASPSCKQLAFSLASWLEKGMMGT